MRVEFVNPIIEGAQKVLATEIQAEVQRGSLSVNNSPCTTGDVTTIVAVTGAVEGFLLLSVSAETARASVSTMVGQPFEEMNELAVSGIAELGNVIAGTATIALAESGFPSKVAPPVVVIGSGTRISTVNIQRLVVPLSTPVGQVEVQVALKEVPANARSTEAPADLV